jgi:hypothetical protein
MRNFAGRRRPPRTMTNDTEIRDDRHRAILASPTTARRQEELGEACGAA